MNGTLFSLDLLGSPVGFMVAGLVGFLFGFFLEQAGFGSSRRLTGIFYFRDMAVLKVMFTAIVVALVGMRYLTAMGLMNPADIHLMDTYWGAQIVGGAIFGIGFVVGGWCPGTAFAGVASAKLDAVVFLVGAGLGSILFNELFPLLERLYSGMNAGPLTLVETTGLSMDALTFLLCVAAVIAFALGSMAEQNIGGMPAPTPRQSLWHRRAGLGLLILALVLFFVPDQPRGGYAPAATGLTGPGEASLLAGVDQGDDHMEASDLARELMSQAADLVVVDIRSADEYAKFHLRGAVNIPLSELAGRLAELPRDRRIVLYSNGTTHAAQAWLEMRRWGFERVRVLTDGILGFWRECLTPPSLTADLVDEATALARREGYRQRRAWFIEGKPAEKARLPAGEKEKPAPAALVEPGLGKRLVSTAWLAEQLREPGVRIVDVRSKSVDYTQGHIAGAVHLSYESLRATVGGVPSMLLPAADIAAALGRVGIKPTDTVILYSDTMRDTTLVAMGLERVGHRHYALLHGGIKKWLAENRPVNRSFPEVAITRYEAAPVDDLFTISIPAVKNAIGNERVVILDVRPADYFSGKKSDEARAGHIPGAVNREYVLDLVPGGELWQDAALLRAEYEKLGVTPDKQIIVHCRTGHQGSQTYFLLTRLLGYPNVKWFDISWAGWAAHPELPVEKQ